MQHFLTIKYDAAAISKETLKLFYSTTGLIFLSINNIVANDVAEKSIILFIQNNFYVNL